MLANFVKEFREFALKGSVVDMAIGIIIGGAFGGLVKSLVSDIIMPPIGLVLGGVDFTNIFIVLKEGHEAGPYSALSSAQSAGAVTVNVGLFINSIVSFGILALAVFMLVRGINSLRRKAETSPAAPDTKPCQFCMSTVPLKAVRCPFCTSELKV